MKLQFIYPIILLVLFSVACSEDDTEFFPTNELEGLTKIQELSNDSHVVELYSKSGTLSTGYNVVSVRIKNLSNNTYVENAEITWLPVMQMPTMNHSCPKSDPVQVANMNALYQGFMIYQMTNSDGSGWSLTIDYTIDDVSYTVSSELMVFQSNLQNVSSFMGSDDSRYVVALIEPEAPIIGINEMVVGVYKMETMMSFPVVENYLLTLDPRMPGMGNHSSPNNTDLTYQAEDELYRGNLSLTMTGYWVLNLKLLNEVGEVLKGEDVTEENIQSSLYFELEF
ncbi:hypothetical protein LRR18_10875 [Mangrovimonas sp. AS39]|uniref:hypothetical protein n=1 Tax=Mangrovimonas futianensis TaxID=2895523 RepID=UPI001E2B8540|nr:hypothetical protein [Mangrovimonas futianensis]MCF1192087.1 hypothetical protein [Mangrovimonas futianensis]MCF1195781.1 hypothetical protein [Mangrovimonas futianensis]